MANGTLTVLGSAATGPGFRTDFEFKWITPFPKTNTDFEFK